jgi:HNH endonuclease
MAVLVKCNASDVTPGNESFSGELLVEKQAHLAEGDEVFIWTSERPRQRPNGKGLEMRGRLVSSAQSGSSAKVEIKVQIRDRLPEASLSMNDLAEMGRKSAPTRGLYERIHKFRHPRIWKLDEEERKLLNDVFNKEQLGNGDEILDDIGCIEKDGTISQTTRKALVDARLGQGRFRNELVRRWGYACAVTGCKISSLLRASHIKPWRSSSNAERLDPANGFLLAAHLDALFDAGLISFGDDGQMLLTDRLPAEDAIHFHLPSALRLKLTSSEKAFLQYHRDNRFKPVANRVG